MCTLICYKKIKISGPFVISFTNWVVHGSYAHWRFLVKITIRRNHQ